MKSFLVQVLSLSLLGATAFGATPSSEGGTHRDLIFAQAGKKELKLDLYLPTASSKPAPVLIWIHGGAWQMGGKAFPYAQFFTNSGFALASIDYRLTNEAPFPAQINDCKAAVRWLRSNAAKYHLDPHRIIAVGASAGGHLAALLGTTANDPRLEGTSGPLDVSSEVQAVCDFSGPSDLLTIRSQYPRQPGTNRTGALTALLGGTVEERPQLARLASPALQVTSKACPFFIAHGDQDAVVPLQQSQELQDALTKAGVSSTLQVVKGGGHGLTDPLVYAAALAFLQKQLGP